MLLYMLRLSEVEQSRLSVCILLQLWSRLKPVVSHLSSAFFEHQSILTVLGWIYVHVERYGVSLAEDGKVTYSGRSSRSQNQMFLSWKPWNWHCLWIQLVLTTAFNGQGVHRVGAPSVGFPRWVGVQSWVVPAGVLVPRCSLIPTSRAKTLYFFPNHCPQEAEPSSSELYRWGERSCAVPGMGQDSGTLLSHSCCRCGMVSSSPLRALYLEKFVFFPRFRSLNFPAGSLLFVFCAYLSREVQDWGGNLVSLLYGEVWNESS